MIRKGIVKPQTVSGLRTRYTPKSRIGQGFVGLAPWFDVVLIAVFFVLLETKFVLQPGVVVELPRAPDTGGLSSDLIAVVLSVESGVRGARDEIVFFEDDRYRVSDPRQMNRLQGVLRSRARKSLGSGLVIQADQAVRQGTLAELLEMARQVGVPRVSLATRSGRSGVTTP
jgi:biopolymer transport protein ExbD